MRERYFSVCKCRLCGETRSNLAELSILTLKECEGPHLHLCADNSVGAADFQGFKIYKENASCSN